MQKKITESTATYGLGHPSGKKLLKVSSGNYTGRMAAIVQSSSGTIKLFYADAPYTSWSLPIEIATDAIDDAFTAAIESNGNIHVVYTETSTENLVTKKLTFSNGSWTVGGKVTVYTGDPAYFPSVAIEAGGTIWVSYTRINGGLYFIYAKSSTDGGAVWGSGSGDAGTVLSSGLTAAFSKIVIGPNELYVTYTADSSDLYFTKRALGGGSWSASSIIATSGTFNEQFDLAVNIEGLIGVVFDNDQLRYREYDGLNWGATATIDSDGGSFPQVTFFSNVPVIVYLHEYAAGQIEVKQTNRQTGTFSVPAVLDTRSNVFDNVLLYDSVSSTVEDLTTEAASETTADVIHSSTNALVEAVGDSLYLGMSKKFRFVRIILSTAGIGGSVNYSYWDGTVWKAFVPEGGNYQLDSADRELILWADYESIPDDWQLSIVDGTVRFWVRVSVDTAFSSAPVGSQLTALANQLSICVRR